jgi:hypothetical protein
VAGATVGRSDRSSGSKNAAASRRKARFTGILTFLSQAESHVMRLCAPSVLPDASHMLAPPLHEECAQYKAMALSSSNKTTNQEKQNDST